MDSDDMFTTPTADERRVNVGIALLVTNFSGMVLMGQRQGSHGEGTWSLIGGWMRHGESFLDAARREAKEEADLNIQTAMVVGAISTVFPDEDVHSVTVLLVAEEWEGVPKRMEPDKLIRDWGWFSPDNLPSPLFKPLSDMSNPSFKEKLIEMFIREGLDFCSNAV